MGDWSNVKPSTLLGLYAYAHEKVYGIFPEELADEWYPALSTATRCLEKVFAGDGEEAANFVRWTWVREKKQFKKRIESGGTFRIGWRFQFSQKLITDYRVATQA